MVAIAAGSLLPCVAHHSPCCPDVTPPGFMLIRGSRMAPACRRFGPIKGGRALPPQLAIAITLQVSSSFARYSKLIISPDAGDDIGCTAVISCATSSG